MVPCLSAISDVSSLSEKSTSHAGSSSNSAWCCFFHLRIVNIWVEIIILLFFIVNGRNPLSISSIPLCLSQPSVSGGVASLYAPKLILVIWIISISGPETTSWTFSIVKKENWDAKADNKCDQFHVAVFTYATHGKGHPITPTTQSISGNDPLRYYQKRGFFGPPQHVLDNSPWGFNRGTTVQYFLIWVFTTSWEKKIIIEYLYFTYVKVIFLNLLNKFQTYSDSYIQLSSLPKSALWNILWPMMSLLQNHSPVRVFVYSSNAIQQSCGVAVCFYRNSYF